jgi:hypothetical protein
MNTVRAWLMLCSLLWALLAGASAFAAAPHIDAEIPAARLAGEGSYRWFGLKVYDAQLWVGDAGYRSDTGFALDLHYARNLSGAKIAEASRDEISKLGIGTPAQHAAWLASMTRLFPDVAEGDRLTGIFMPGLGARFYFNGKLRGEISDVQFASAFFAIWLDAKTTAPALRKALLSKAGVNQ